MTTSKLLRRIGLRRRPSLVNRVATEIGKGIVAPPATKWGAKAISKEVLHHTVYATAVDATYRALS